MMMLKRCLVLSAFAALAGCQSTGEEYQADVFDATQVNRLFAFKGVADF